MTPRPSPTGGRTDSLGRYVALAQVMQAVSNACVRITYADTLHADTSGVTLHTTSPPADTLHLDIIAP